MRASFAALAAALIAAASARAEPLEVRTHAIERFNIGRGGEVFGKLRFLGGLDLVFSDPRAGGLSGIVVSPDGRNALMVSDQGYMLAATLEHEDGRLAGVADATTIDPLFGEGVDKHEGDAEDLALDPADPDAVLIAFERRRTPLLRFRRSEGGLEDPRPVEVPDAVRDLGYNKGLESVAVAPPASPQAGRVVLVAERAAARDAPRIPGWILGAGPFEIARRDDFDITSVRFLDDGDLLLLERRFTPATGIGMRLRRMSGEDLKPGALLDGEVLMEAGMLQQIDNMEGLAIHEDAQGRTILTLVSDDNRSILQRALLLQFALEEDG